MENCIVCGKPVEVDGELKGEGRIHDKCYTMDVVMIVQDNP